MYYLVFAVFCIGFFIIYRTIHSPFGQILKAIRENEPRAISLGYDVAKFKLLAFVISARSPAWRAPPRPWCSSSPRSPTSTGTCPARWC
jgi:ABC-type uncharacterized transport system permease subunit